MELDNISESKWYAIRTRQESRAFEHLSQLCEEVFFPTQTVRTEGRGSRLRAVIPHVMFIRTTPENAVEIEKNGRLHPDSVPSIWIYRYPTDSIIREIPQSSIALLRLLTADDTTRCEIFTKADFRENQKVRVTGGFYKGYEGFVQRVKKNRHVIVRIEGICLVMLPFIHPDLLEPLEVDLAD